MSHTIGTHKTDEGERDKVTSSDARSAQATGDEKVVNTQAAPYTEENDNFVPDPTAVYGTLDTSGTAGGLHERIENVSPVFEAAKAQDLQTAARALDPEDREVDASLVNTSQAVSVVQGDPEGDKQRVLDAAEHYKENPVEVRDPSQAEAERRAEEDEGKSDEQKAAEREQEQRSTTAAGSDRTTPATTQDEGEADKSKSATAKKATAKKTAAPR